MTALAQRRGRQPHRTGHVGPALSKRRQAVSAPSPQRATQGNSIMNRPNLRSPAGDAPVQLLFDHNADPRIRTGARINLADVGDRIVVTPAGFVESPIFPRDDWAG
jgi:hypothetical protein